MFDPADTQFGPAPERDGLLTAEQLQLRMQTQVMINNLLLQSGMYQTQCIVPDATPTSWSNTAERR